MRTIAKGVLIWTGTARGPLSGFVEFDSPQLDSPNLAR